ncbi:MAG TPA: homocysteine S-methyltransferase family protein [Anaerolineae bacterium]|nr:homocysteine S-methyltransferase family protein [Anaerolineae bacterium]
MSFLKRLNTGETLLADGAMGTMLQAAGLEKGHAPEEMTLDLPDKVLAVHRGYVDAGSDIILTNTFGANRFRLEKYGLADRVYDISRRAAEIAREAGAPFVAGSIGPTGEFFAPMGTLTPDGARETFAEQARGLADGGVDLLVIETMSDLYEVEAAIEAARESTDLPLLCTMTFQQKLHTVMGVTAREAAETLSGWGAAAMGANCGTGPDEVEHVLEQMKQAVPGAVLIAKPNAGVPRLVKGRTEYDATPQTMAEYAQRFAQLGVTIIGACCGSTPEHIAAMAGALGKSRPR